MLRTEENRISAVLSMVVILVALSFFARNAYRHKLHSDLLEAAKMGDTARVKTLLNKGADPNTPGDDTDARTPLQQAIANHHADTAVTLLKHGAKPERDMAAQAGGEKDARLPLALVERGEAPEDALHWAVFQDNAVQVQVLFARCPTLKTQIASKSMLADVASLGFSDLIPILLDNGAQINAWDYTGATPLMRAAMTGQSGVIRLLLARGADVHLVNKLGYTALAYADLCEYPDIADILWQANEGHRPAAPDLKALTQAPANLGAVSGPYLEDQAKSQAEGQAQMARLERVRHLYKQDQTEAGIAAVQQALKIHPSDPEAHLLLGYSLHEQNKLDAAMAAYRLAARDMPQSPWPTFYQGTILEHQQKPIEALAAYRKTVKIDPYHCDAFHDMAELLRKQGKTAEAQEADKQALMASEEHYKIGMAYVQQGKQDKALDELDTYVKIAGDAPQAKEHVAKAKAYLRKVQPTSGSAPAERAEP